MMEQKYIVIIVCVVAAGVIIWREVQRTNKAYLAWRILAVLVAIVALACIILPLSYTGTVNPNEQHEAILLTEGFSPDSLKNYATNRVFAVNKASHKAYPKASLISSAGELARMKPVINHIHVFGYGLGKAELNELKDILITFHPAAVPEGIQSVSWNEKLKSGEKLSVQGNLNNPGKDNLKLTLKGLGTTLDSVFLTTSGAFNLTSRPKQVGKAIYRLIVTNEKDTLANESVPFEVNTTKPLQVLILASAPDFENKFLKNWLSENQYGVAVRNQISKNKYSQEFANVSQQSLQHITPSVLSKFDVVVSDLEVMKSLPSAEAVAIKEQLQQDGLGLIVRADSTTQSNNWIQQRFPLTRTSSQGQMITALKLQDQAAPTSKLLIDPFFINYRNYTQPLVTDQQNHAVASASLAGAGKIIFTTLSNTHNWMLGGDEDDYTALWSLLITKAAKNIPSDNQVTVKSAIPQINHPVELQVQASAGTPNVIKVNQTSLPAAEQPSLPFTANITYWPRKAGWQQVEVGNNVSWWYAYPANEWQNLVKQQLLNETGLYAANHPQKQSVTKQIQQKVQIAVPKIYFYLVLLAALIWLWVEAKFLNQ